MSIRNIGILAHVDAGKTTITERMLYLSGGIHSLGSVDDGTANTDWLEVERRRGISVRSASTSFKYKNITVNLIDTPGHIDFSGEVERSLRVLDAAVLVISAAEGIEAQSVLLWKALKTLEIPTIIFINKIDRRASDVKKVYQQIEKLFSRDVVALQVLDGENTREVEVVDLLVKRYGYLASGECNIESENYSNIIDIQGNLNSKWELDKLQEEQNKVYEFIAELDEEIMLSYINDKPIPLEKLKSKLKSLIKAADIYPILHGSAINGIGITPLLEMIKNYLPEPEMNEDGPLAGLVYKIDHDPNIGKIAHLRLYSGTMKNRDNVYNQSRDIYEKITQIKKAYSNKYEDIGILKAGDIGIICGLKQTYIGDILGDDSFVPGDYQLANPLLTVEVKPSDKNKITDLIAAFKELEVEDPLLSLEWLKEKREVHIKIMGVIQLVVLESILKDRFNISVSFGDASVIYKETPIKTGEGFVRYTMPKPCWAVLRFKIEPGEPGSGLVYKSEVRPDILPLKYQKQVERTMPGALEQGLYGWEVTDLEVTLIDGEYHIEHTHAPDFMVATPMGIMNGLTNTETTLLEPILWFQITVPEDLSGKVLGDLIQMRAEYENPQIINGKFSVEGTVPVATSLDYSIKLSSFSAGRGLIKTKFDGYKKCSIAEGATCPRRGVNPLDRAKYILSVRNAL